MNKGYNLTKDISPPNRIIDFTLKKKEDESLTLYLAWTAPGGDFDYEKGTENNGQLNPTLNLIKTQFICLDFGMLKLNN